MKQITIENFNPNDLHKFLMQSARENFDENRDEFNAGMSMLMGLVKKYFCDDFDIAIRDNNGWICVEDGLPRPEQEIKFLDDGFEPKNFYLVQLKNGFIDTAYYATICDDCEYNDIFISCTVNAKENRYYVQERGFDTYAIDDIKYWQPLPEAPKEQKKVMKSLICHS